MHKVQYDVSFKPFAYKLFVDPSATCWTDVQFDWNLISKYEGITENIFHKYRA